MIRTFSLKVSANGDNGFGLAGSWDTTAILLGSTTYVGVRILYVPIPAHSKILSALVSFTARTNRAVNTCSMNVYLEDADNPEQVVSGADINGRSVTAAVAWSAISAQTANVVYNTPDLSVPMQTIVDRDGWAYGNAIHIILKDNGSSVSALRDEYPFSVDNTKAPLLTVTYQLPLTRRRWRGLISQPDRIPGVVNDFNYS